jgi:uncharacterized membrane protein YidH (DUF202 family)
VSRAARSGCLYGGGIVGAMLAAAFAPMQCARCGEIPTHEFPPEDRNSMTMTTVGLVIGALVLLVVVIGIIVLVNVK